MRILYSIIKTLRDIIKILQVFKWNKRPHRTKKPQNTMKPLEREVQYTRKGSQKANER